MTNFAVLLFICWIYLGGVGLTDQRYDWGWPVKLGKALALWANAKSVLTPEDPVSEGRTE
jgi:hypothetical protein